jgi:hypothetical protein
MRKSEIRNPKSEYIEPPPHNIADLSGMLWRRRLRQRCVPGGHALPRLAWPCCGCRLTSPTVALESRVHTP